jgi:hypothetical protein
MTSAGTSPYARIFVVEGISADVKQINDRCRRDCLRQQTIAVALKSFVKHPN